jgi:putative membrane protein
LILLVLWAGKGFISSAEAEWTQAAWVLLGGTVALSLAALHTLSLLAGGRTALQFMASTLAISWLAETMGLRHGWPFGAFYHYNSQVRPILPGGVPLFIPLAWFVLASFPAMLLRGLPTAGPDGGRKGHRILYKSALGALGMVACDLALDPVAVSLGLWKWEFPGPYFGVPLLNFAGWWGVAFVVFLAGYGWLGLDRTDESGIPLRYDLAWGLAQGALLVLLGFGSFNRIGSVWPLLLSIMVMAPLGMRWMGSVYWTVQSCRSVRRGHGGCLTGGGSGG